MPSIGGLQLQHSKAFGGVPAFSPAMLYSSGQPGAWYEPSDFTTGYQDSAGTTQQTAVEQPTGRRSDKSGRGNHALQATAAARPVVSARVNLLTKSEDLTDSVWVKGGSGATPPVVTARPVSPTNPQLAADKVVFPAVSGASVFSLVYQSLTQTTGTPSVQSVTLKGDVGGEVVWIMWTPNGGTFSRTQCVLTTTLQTFTAPYTTTTTGTQYFQIGVDLRDTSQTAKPAQTIYVGTTQVETGSVATTYQRINTATDYNAIGFPTYDKFNGTQSSLSSAGGGGATTGFFWCGAVKPLSGVGTLRTLWSDAGTNTGYRIRLTAANVLEFSAGSGVALAPPVQSAATTSVVGGTGLAAATAYFYVITALNAAGESLQSNESTVTTGAGTLNSNTLTWAASTGATNYRVYRGTTAGVENVFYAAGNVLSYVDTGAASSAGAPPTTTETAYTKVTSVATVGVGATSLLTVWSDGTNLNVQVGSGAVASILIPATSAGTAGFTEGKDNGLATNFLGSNNYAAVYRTGTVVTPTERANVQAYVRSKAGL